MEKWEDAKVNTFNGFQHCLVGKVVGAVAKLFGISAVIDHVFVSTRLTAKSFKVDRRHNPLLSDHYPVIA